MRKDKAPKFKKDFADDEDEGGVTDLRRIDEDAGDDDHNRTMKIILSGLEATAILEQDAAKKKSQVDINSRLAKPSARFRLFGQADELEGTDHSSKERRRPLFWRPFSAVTEPPPGLLVPLSGILASRRRKPRKNEKKRGKNRRDTAI